MEEQDIIVLSENDEEESPSIKDKKRVKTYLQGFKILAYLKDRVNNDKKLKLDFKDAFNQVCAYAKSTIEAYDKWVYNYYEAQVWQHYYDLGQKKDHWAKDLVNITHTREAKKNMLLCEKKISQFTSACFDANNIIARNMKNLSSDPTITSATIVTNRAHDLMLDYMKEATQGLSKMSINKIRRASIEKDEWDALKTFENVASEQQKIYAKTFCKPAMKSYHKKKKNFDLVAAHISYDIIPKILPQYDFNLPLDETSLSSEQIQVNKENIHELSRNFRLKATELYLKIKKEEFDFQKERFKKLLEDFPHDRDEIPETQLTYNMDEDVLTQRAPSRTQNIDVLGVLTQRAPSRTQNIDDLGVLTQRAPSRIQNIDDLGVLTQRAPPQTQENIFQTSFELFIKYTEIALKRVSLEIEREIHFLADRSVKEMPFVIQEARDLNPVLRKDFVLQA